MASLSSEDIAYYKKFPSAMAVDGITPEMLTDTTDQDPYSRFNDPYDGAPMFPLDPDKLQDKIKKGQQERANEKVARETGDLTYQGIYPKKPEVSTLDKAKATTSDFLNWATSYEGELNEEQQAVADLPEATASWQQEAEEIYRNTGVQQPDGSQIYTEFNPTEDGVVKKDFLIPPPNSGFWERVGREGLVGFAKDMSGLSRGEITTDSSEYTSDIAEEDKNFNQKVPSQKLRGGEQFLADLWSIAVPMTAAAKVTQGIFRGIKAGATLNRAAKLGGLGNVSAATISGSIVETIAASEKQEGLFIRTPTVKTVLNNLGADLDDKDAKDIAVLIDGLLINGALDGVLTVLAPLGRMVTGKSSVASFLVNKEGMTRAIQDGIVLNVAEYLDPKMFKGASANQVARNFKVLAKVLNQEKIVNLKIGDFEKELDVPTVQALMNGAESYMRETRQSMASKMTPDAYENMIQSEADLMFKRMAALAKSQASNPQVQGLDQKLMADMGDMFRVAGEAKVPNGVDDAATTTVGNLARVQSNDVAIANADVVDAATNVAAAKTSLDNVVSENRAIQLLEADFEKLRSTREDQTLVAEWTQSTAYPKFNSMKQGVQDAYKAIPNDRIGTQAAEELFSVLSEVVRKQNVFDTDGRKARFLLGEIYTAITNRKMKQETIERDLFGPDGIFVMRNNEVVFRPENNAELFTRLGQSIGVQDVLNLRPKLKELRDGTEKSVAAEIDKLRKHITNPYDNGFLAFPAGPTRDAAMKADQLFKDFDNTWRNNKQIIALSDVFQKQREARNLSTTDKVSLQKGQRDSNEAMEAYLKNANEDISGQNFNHLIETIDETVGATGPTVGFISDLVFARMMQQVSTAATEGMDAKGLQALISPYMERLRASNNGQMADRLMQTINDIDVRKTELGDELAGAESALKVATQAVKTAENSILANLMSKVEMPTGGVGGIARTDSRKALSDILIRPDQRGTQALLQKIEELPAAQALLARQALQAVALDTIGAKIFGTTIGGFSKGKPVKMVSPSQAAKLLDPKEAQGLMNSLDLIFPANSLDPTAQTVREGVFKTLETIYGTSVATNLRDVPVGSNTAVATTVAKETGDAVSTSILLLAGYMNPTAAMARRLTSAPLKEAIELEKEISKHVLAAIITSPEQFAKLIKMQQQNAQVSLLRQAALTTLRTARLDGRYQIRIRDEEDDSIVGKQMKEMGIDVGESIYRATPFADDTVREGSNWPN